MSWIEMIGVGIAIAALTVAWVGFLVTVAEENGRVMRFGKEKRKWEEEVDRVASERVRDGQSPDEAMKEAVEEVNGLRQISATRRENLARRGVT